MSSASAASVDVSWRYDQRQGHVPGTTYVVGSTVITVEGTVARQAAVRGDALLSFLDEFDALPDVASALPDARRKIAAEAIDRKGYTTLRDLRMQAGMSQKEFATCLGTSQSRVSLIETRAEKPSEDTLRGMATALQVNFDTLMDALSNAGK